MTDALIEAGDLAAAESACAAALARCRDAGDAFDLPQLLMADGGPGRAGGPFPGRRRAPARRAPDRRAGRRRVDMLGNGLWSCALLCTATGRYAEAATVWAAHAAYCRQQGIAGEAPGEARRRAGSAEPGPAGARTRPGPGGRRARRGDEPGHRGRVRPDAHRPRPRRRPRRGPGPGRLSARERELVTLVAQGRTDADIAAQLYISIRTVRSHLDRIRDKTGCRRRADLTRLALAEGLV